MTENRVVQHSSDGMLMLTTVWEAQPDLDGEIGILQIEQRVFDIRKPMESKVNNLTLKKHELEPMLKDIERILRRNI